MSSDLPEEGCYLVTPQHQALNYRKNNNRQPSNRDDKKGPAFDVESVRLDQTKSSLQPKRWGILEQVGSASRIHCHHALRFSWGGCGAVGCMSAHRT